MSRSIFGWSYPPGCNSVPGDEPYHRLIDKRCARAAADYICHNCSQPIKRGTYYERELIEEEDGSIFAAKMHMLCPYEEEMLGVVKQQESEKQE